MSAVSGIYYCKAFNEEKCRSMIPHVLKVGHHTTGSTLSINKSAKIALVMNCIYIWGLYHLVYEEGVAYLHKIRKNRRLDYCSNEADSVAIV